MKNTGACMERKKWREPGKELPEAPEAWPEVWAAWEKPLLQERWESHCRNSNPSERNEEGEERSVLYVEVEDEDKIVF